MGKTLKIIEIKKEAIILTNGNQKFCVHDYYNKNRKPLRDCKAQISRRDNMDYNELLKITQSHNVMIMGL